MMNAFISNSQEPKCEGSKKGPTNSEEFDFVSQIPNMEGKEIIKCDKEYNWWSYPGDLNLRKNGKNCSSFMRNNYHSENGNRNQINNLKILIAEDSLITQKLIQRMLLKLNIRIDISNNGKEAVNAAAQNVYDIILMDIQMPEMNGLEATRRILNNNGNFKKPVIIAITSDTEPNNKQRCFEYGMQDYIHKPITNEILINTIKKWIQK